MIQDKPEELHAMLRDMENAPAIYRPSNYWNNYQRESYGYIEARGIGEFRSQQNMLWSSFGAVADPLLGYARPLLANLSRARQNTVSRLLFKVGRRVPLVKQLIAFLDAAWLWERLAGEYEKQLRMLLELGYHYCRSLDDQKLIEQVGDPGLGAPNIIMDVGGKKYTLHFLRYFLQYLYLSRFVDFKTIGGVIEIGGGYGGLAEIILRLNPHLVYVNVDIPPQIYIAQQYLDACFPGEVCSYSESQKAVESQGGIYPQNHPGRRIFTLCPWQLPAVKGSYDLFINSASLQEMEPEIVENYAAQIKQRVTHYGYIRAIPGGVGTAQKAGESGTLQKVTKDHYLKYFDTFQLIDESQAAVLPRLPGAGDQYRDMFFTAREQAPAKDTRSVSVSE